MGLCFVDLEGNHCAIRRGGYQFSAFCYSDICFCCVDLAHFCCDLFARCFLIEITKQRSIDVDATVGIFHCSVRGCVCLTGCCGCHPWHLPLHSFRVHPAPRTTHFRRPPESTRLLPQNVLMDQQFCVSFLGAKLGRRF